MSSIVLNLDTIFVLYVDLICLISLLLYLNDGSSRYYQDKNQKIGGFPAGKFVIKFVFFSSFVMVNLFYLADVPRELVLWNSVWMQVLGMIVAGVGVSIFVVAKTTLGTQYSPCFKSYVPRQIVRESVYKWIRHPIYLGNSLIYLGMVFATGSLFFIAAFLVMQVVYAHAIRSEEAALSEAFPDYRFYMQQTGAILPKFRRIFVNASEEAEIVELRPGARIVGDSTENLRF